MIEDVRDLLPLYALGILDADEAAAVERALAIDDIAAELAGYQRATDSFVAPVLPSPEVKARLLASIGAGRFEPFATQIAALFDVALERARGLGLIERPASWATHAPGLAMVQLSGGPAVARAHCGFIRISPGGMFPLHRHVGEEAALVLTGRVHDVTHDRVLGPGDSWTLAGGTHHLLVGEGTEDCICAVRALDGIAFGGASPKA